jgi:N-acetylmuramoyl-L-alanine amidase
MDTKRLFCVLMFSTFGLMRVNAANVTDAFLHQGLTHDYVIFYTDVPVKTRTVTAESGDQTRVLVFLADVAIPQKKFLQHLNNKTPRGYEFSCDYQQHDVVCSFLYPRGTCNVHVSNQTNWHDIATVVIECKRTVPLAPLAHRDPLIVLDAGHGGSKPGAHGLFGLVEKNLTLRFCKKVRACLTARGYNVLLTRESDYWMPLDERTSLANLHGATLLISFHCNNARDKQARGVETLYSTPNSKTLAQFIHEQIAQIPLKNVVDRGVKMGLLQTLFGCECPAVMLELFFLSNTDDAQQLKDDRLQAVITTSVCKAIDKFMALQK